MTRYDVIIRHWNGICHEARDDRTVVYASSQYELLRELQAMEMGGDEYDAILDAWGPGGALVCSVHREQS